MEQQDFLAEMEQDKLPSTLNVLTILTFIGSAFLLWDVYKLVNIDSEVAKVQEALNKTANMGQMPEFVKTMADDAVNIVKARAANKIPLIIFELIAVILCVYGAIKMRARKMEGFYLYLIGEILPIIGMGILIGGIMFKGFQLAGLFFPILFIVLYAFQRKHLTK